MRKNIDKEKQMAQVAREIIHCKLCKLGKSGKPVVGEGNLDAKIAFIGEAPGREEAKTGRPFVGRSGKLLRTLISKVGLKEEDAYITSPVKYLPDIGTPSKADIAHGMTHLSKQLEIINPEIIVLLGSTAVQGVLGEKMQITKVHGKVVRKADKTYFITLHPAAAIRFVKFKSLLESDFGKLLAQMKKSHYT